MWVRILLNDRKVKSCPSVKVAEIWAVMTVQRQCYFPAADDEMDAEAQSKCASLAAYTQSCCD